MGNNSEFLFQMADASLGGHVLVGLTTTRRGSALLADPCKADVAQLIVDDATAERMRVGMYWSGDLAYRGSARGAPCPAAHRCDVDPGPAQHDVHLINWGEPVLSGR